MKKLNIQVYQGDPSGLVTKDNNNLFIEGDVQYSTGAGTIVKSVTSIKNSNGEEIMSGGGGGDLDPDVVEYLEEHPEIKYNETCGLMSYYDIDENTNTDQFYFQASQDGIEGGAYLGSALPPVQDESTIPTYWNAYNFKIGATILCKSTDGHSNIGTITFTEDVTITDFETIPSDDRKLVPASSFTFNQFMG